MIFQQLGFNFEIVSIQPFLMANVLSFYMQCFDLLGV